MISKGRVFVALLLLFVGTAAFADLYPLPAKTPATPVSCASCGPNGTPSQTIGYLAPITTFTGRFLDSSAVQEYFYPFRTARVNTVLPVPSIDRIYFLYGYGSIAVYPLSTFFSRLESGEALVYPLSVTATQRVGAPEKFLQWGEWFNPEMSSWKWTTTDGATRLTGFDVDDKGYVYLASTVYGWGIVKDGLDNGGGVMQSMFQKFPQNPQDATPNGIVYLKSGTRYFAYLSSKTQPLWDVTNKSNPVLMQKVPALPGPFAKNAAADHFCMTDATATLNCWSVDSFVGNGSPSYVSPYAGYQKVTSDGTNFFALRPGANSTTFMIDVIVPSGTGYALLNSYPIVAHGNSISNFHYGDGFIILTGLDFYSGGWDLQVFKLGANFAPSEIVMNGTPASPATPSYFRNYYSLPPTGYARPGNINIIDGVAYKGANGTDYLIMCGKGIGDVYALAAGDSIQVSNDGPRGTPNPYAPAASNTQTFYADPIQFTGRTASQAVQSVSWNFGNPEAGNINSQQLTAPNTSIVYQYSNLAKAGVGTKNVQASSVSDATVRGVAAVNLKMPTARFGIAGGVPLQYLFTQPNASSPAPVIAGDSFVDASDGTVESHYSSWTIDGVTTNGLPGDLIPVGQCGYHSLVFTSVYGPHAGTGASLTTSPLPATPFVVGLDAANDPFGYMVKPFVAGVTLVGADPTNSANLLFRSTSRVNLALVTAASGFNYSWDVVNANGQSLLNVPGAGPAIPDFSVPRSYFNLPNLRVQLKLTANAPFVGTCAGMEMTVAQTDFINAPDPKITMTGDCQTTPCTFTAGSLSGADMVANSWTFNWQVLLNGAPVDSSYFSGLTNLSTFTPAFLKPGTFIVRLTATNAIGSNIAQSPTITIAAPQCPKMTNASFQPTFQGPTTGCSSVPGGPACQSGESVTFNAQVGYGSGYDPSCSVHTYKWTFPDGGTATTTDVSVTHAVTAGGMVTLLVTNTTGDSHSYSVALTVGSSNPPPPPPSGNGCSGMSAANVPPAWSGASCPAGMNCATNDPLAFSIQTYLYPSTCLVSASWRFEGGSPVSGLANVMHTFTTDGPHSVQVTVTNSAGENVPRTFTVTTAPGQTGGSNPCGAMNNNTVFVGYSGSAGCSTGSACSNGETLTFSLQTIQVSLSCGNPQFDWDFGDGSAHGTGASPTHAYTTAGAHSGAVTITNQYQTFSRTFSVTTNATGGTGSCMHITPNITLSITYSNANNTCGPLGASCAAGTPVNFDILLYGGYDLGCATHTYDWDFGDGSPHGTVKNPTHTYVNAATYPAKCTVSNGSQTVTLTQSVAIGTGNAGTPTVQPSITVATMQGVANGYIFTAKFDHPEVVASFGWNFGDGVTQSGSGTPSNPTPAAHIYPDDKKYTVTLTAYSSNGQSIGVVNAPNTPTVEKRRSVRH